MIAGDPTPKPSALAFLNVFWREMSFAAVRWEVLTSVWGYLWLPLVGLGGGGVLWEMRREHPLPSSPRLVGGGDQLPLPMSGEGRGGVAGQRRMNSTP